MSKEVRYKDRVLSGTQVIGYTANWTIIDGARRSVSGPQLHGSRGAERRARRHHQRRDGDEAVRRLRSARQGSDGRRLAVHGDRHLSLPGELPRRRQSPARDRAVRVGGAVAQGLVRRRRHRRRAARRRDARSRPRTTSSRRCARATRCVRRTDNDFAIITQDKLFETYNKIFGMFFLVMIVLSAIGLIVGGVGVVAIMMISVTERTREIGVRKALGATRGTILWQFLVEAVTLTGIGAMFGLVVRRHRVGDHSQCDTNSGVDPAARDRRGAGRERGHGRDVRHAPGDARREARSGGRAAVRIAVGGRPAWSRDFTRHSRSTAPSANASLEAVRLALAQIRVQKLKSFFTLLGVMIGVMFLIAVVSIVEGMGRYMEDDFAGRLLGANTFTLRRYPWFGNNTTRERVDRVAASAADLRRGRRARASDAARRTRAGPSRASHRHMASTLVRAAAQRRDPRRGRRLLHDQEVRPERGSHDRAAGVRARHRPWSSSATRWRSTSSRI